MGIEPYVNALNLARDFLTQRVEFGINQTAAALDTTYNFQEGLLSSCSILRPTNAAPRLEWPWILRALPRL